MNTHLIYYVLPLLLIFKYYNYLRTKNASLRAENKMAALNSKLHYLEITGKVNSQDAIYAFLDFQTTHYSAKMRRINFWVISYCVLIDLIKHHENKNAKSISTALNANENYKAIWFEYAEISQKFIGEKSIFSLTACKWFLEFILFLRKGKIALLESKFKQNLLFPETGAAYPC